MWVKAANSLNICIRSRNRFAAKDEEKIKIEILNEACEGSDFESDGEVGRKSKIVLVSNVSFRCLWLVSRIVHLEDTFRISF